MMIELPPGPYDYATTHLVNRRPGTGHVYLVDATGRKIASIWGKPDEKMALVKAIIDASQNWRGEFSPEPAPNETRLPGEGEGPDG